MEYRFQSISNPRGFVGTGRKGWGSNQIYEILQHVGKHILRFTSPHAHFSTPHTILKVMPSPDNVSCLRGTETFEWIMVTLWVGVCFKNPQRNISTSDIPWRACVLLGCSISLTIWNGSGRRDTKIHETWQKVGLVNQLLGRTSLGRTESLGALDLLTLSCNLYLLLL